LLLKDILDLDDKLTLAKFFTLILMKSIFLLCIAIALSINILAQDSTKVYNPLANGSEQIKSAIIRAKTENKHVFVQIGGNWCPWCLKFNKFCRSDQKIDSLLNTKFVVVHLNYSKENKNPDVLRQLGFPQRFGFPVFVVLDASGQRQHTQNSAYLELNDGYDRKKVMDFLKAWTPDAIKPENYK
jgi:thiol:disulfide interchange protein